MRTLLLSIALLLPLAPATGQDVIDTHVHLWNGEASIKEYQAQLKAANNSVDAFGAM
ncbi:MAG: amidohydrolase, partial [Sphingomonadales bacterium]